MSVKAKIEAVIYASEEPVTLPQLVGLLGVEAQAELDALASQQTSLALDTPSDQDGATPDELNAEILGEPEPELATESVEITADQPERAPTGLSGEESNRPSPKTDGPPETDGPGAPGSESAAEVSTDAPAAPDESAAPDAASPAVAKARERALREYFRSILDQLIADYANGDRGLEIREVAGGFRLATKPEYHDAVRGFVKSLKPPLKLSLQALETLAVVAYKQPVTAPEVSEIRGVDSGGVLGGLMTRKLVTTAGRKQVIGRPILYKTTKDFLVRFGLKDIAELPSIEEFEKMAGELVDADPVQEEIPMPSENASPQLPGDYQSGAPEDTSAFHENTEDVMSDKHEGADGRKTEPPIAAEVEPSAGIHEPQADGDSDDPSADFDPAKGGA